MARRAAVSPDQDPAARSADRRLSRQTCVDGGDQHIPRDDTGRTWDAERRSKGGGRGDGSAGGKGTQGPPRPGGEHADHHREREHHQVVKEPTVPLHALRHASDLRKLHLPPSSGSDWARHAVSRLDVNYRALRPGRTREPELWRRSASGCGLGLARVFTASPGSLQIGPQTKVRTFGDVKGDVSGRRADQGDLCGWH